MSLRKVRTSGSTSYPAEAEVEAAAEAEAMAEEAGDKEAHKTMANNAMGDWYAFTVTVTMTMNLKLALQSKTSQPNQLYCPLKLAQANNTTTNNI